MAKQKKTPKKGNPKKISQFDHALEQSLSQGASQESYQTPPTYTSPTPPLSSASSIPRKKYEKPTLFPRKVMALFTEKQYQELDQLVKKMRQRDGEIHSLNSVIRVAVEKMVNDFR
jgi:hypothetical protein